MRRYLQPDGAAASPSGTERVVKDLVRSLDLAERLQRILESRSATTDAGFTDAAGDLVGEFLASVSRALSALTSPQEAESKQLVRAEKFDLRGAGGKSPTAGKGAGGANKRLPEERRTLMTSRPHDDDGFTWKKYGQKVINGARFPRSYFKCSQWSLNGCRATKHVQRNDHDTSKFAVTYFHNHTCRLPLDIEGSSEPFSIDFSLGQRGQCRAWPSLAYAKCFRGAALPIDQLNVSATGLSNSTSSTEFRHSGLQCSLPVTSTPLTESTESCDNVVSSLRSPSPMSSISNLVDASEFIGDLFSYIDEEFLLS